MRLHKIFFCLMLLGLSGCAVLGNLDELFRLGEYARGITQSGATGLLARARHRQAFEIAEQALTRIVGNVSLPVELMAEELRALMGEWDSEWSLRNMVQVLRRVTLNATIKPMSAEPNDLLKLIETLKNCVNLAA